MAQGYADQGAVFWITGLSGAGKTTLARHLQDRFVINGRSAILLDGDELRQVFAIEGHYTTQERRRLALRYAKLCKLISDQGQTVICATISLFHDVHDWNRQNLHTYYEIYLDVPIETLKARDTKGLYLSAERGERSDVIGIDTDYEQPREPDLVIDTSTVEVEECVRQILSLVD